MVAVPVDNCWRVGQRRCLNSTMHTSACGTTAPTGGIRSVPPFGGRGRWPLAAIGVSVRPRSAPSTTARSGRTTRHGWTGTHHQRTATGPTTVATTPGVPRTGSSKNTTNGPCRQDTQGSGRRAHRRYERRRGKRATPRHRPLRRLLRRVVGLLAGWDVLGCGDAELKEGS